MSKLPWFVSRPSCLATLRQWFNRLVIGSLIVSALAIACGGATSTKGGSELDIEATVEARVSSTVAAFAQPPTPTHTATPPPALYWPTYADYAAVVLPNPGGVTPTLRDMIQSIFLDYVWVYVAGGCVLGEELSAEDFRAFVGQPVSFIEAQAITIGSQMLGQAHERIEGTCIESYMNPQTNGQFFLATGLATSISFGETITLFTRGLRSNIRDRASGLFGLTGEQTQPFLSKLVGDGAPRLDTTAAQPLQRPLHPPEDWVLRLEVQELQRCAAEKTPPRC